MYSLEKIPRGIILIINNINFEKARQRKKQLDDRESSRYDETNLSALFERLRFKVNIHQDKTVEVSTQTHAAYLYTISRSSGFMSKTNKKQATNVYTK